MTQTDIFEQEKVKNRAIDMAGYGADELWSEECYGAGLVLARIGRPFTTDQLWYVMHRKGLKTPEPRAMGAVIRRLVNDKVIKATGNYRKSTRPDCHRRPLQEWIGV